jgi:hypothetical protein
MHGAIAADLVLECEYKYQIAKNYEGPSMGIFVVSVSELASNEMTNLGEDISVKVSDDPCGWRLGFMSEDEIFGSCDYQRPKEGGGSLQVTETITINRYSGNFEISVNIQESDDAIVRLGTCQRGQRKF